uniref:Soluble scavenger receptor cysteine-rich domain-containing protein SSC5D n=1 Tax=Latimeria chalumnae TaxID=7897 RepID=H2ZXD8_LATCH
AGDVRLVDGEDSCAGRVEFYLDGEWGTICHDSWDTKIASLVCKQLNCSHAVSAPTNAYFGKGSGRIWLNKFSCPKDRSYLKECSALVFRGNNTPNCDHESDAGIICSGVKLFNGSKSLLASLCSEMLRLYSTDHGKVRLVDGESRCSGRVEVYYRGEWGTLCDAGWGISAANVVCRQLGCGHAVWAPGEAHFGNGTGPIWLDNIRCSGTESYLWQCGANSLGQHNCTHEQDVGVICSVFLCLILEFLEFENLNDLIPFFGEFKSVLRSRLQDQAAELLCRVHSLDLPHTTPCCLLECFLKPGRQARWILMLSNRVLWDRLYSFESDVITLNVVSVSSSLFLVNMPLRFADGDKPCSGRVEILHNGRWGSVCDGLWDLQDADVVCKELGCRMAISAPGRAHFGEGSGEIWKDDVECDGSKSRLVECPSRPWGQHDCTHRDDAGVVCSGKGEESKSSLFLELDKPEDWAATVYSLLEFRSLFSPIMFADDATCHSRKHGDSVQFYADNFRLEGFMSKPLYTRLNPCLSGKAVMMCHNTILMEIFYFMLILFLEFQLRLINGESLCSGRLEVYHKGSWGRVFDDFWDLSDGQVACRQLRCGNVIAVYTGSRYGKGKGPVWLNRVECQGDEDVLWNCNSSKLNQPQNLRKDAALICSEHRSLRLVSTEGPCTGKIDVFSDGSWGSVCHDSQNVTTANVVCRQLGCGEAMETEYLPRKSGSVWLDEAKCLGNESSLWECSLERRRERDCASGGVAGVFCSGT